MESITTLWGVYPTSFEYYSPYLPYTSCAPLREVRATITRPDGTIIEIIGPTSDDVNSVLSKVEQVEENDD